VALSLAVLLSGACGADPLPSGVARVERVVDGDTVEVTLSTGRERIRLLGIDTPETVHPTKPTECFGPEASARLAELAPVGTELRIERDVELRDRYGRLLAYLWSTDGTFINEALVADGYARTLPIDPNRAHRTTLADAESAARQAGAGLWSACR
jgi:micrococcal nuclease